MHFCNLSLLKGVKIRALHTLRRIFHRAVSVAHQTDEIKEKQNFKNYHPDRVLWSKVQNTNFQTKCSIRYSHPCHILPWFECYRYKAYKSNRESINQPIRFRSHPERLIFGAQWLYTVPMYLRVSVISEILESGLMIPTDLFCMVCWGLRSGRFAAQSP